MRPRRTSRRSYHSPTYWTTSASASAAARVLAGPAVGDPARRWALETTQPGPAPTILESRVASGRRDPFPCPARGRRHRLIPSPTTPSSPEPTSRCWAAGSCADRSAGYRFCVQAPGQRCKKRRQTTDGDDVDVLSRGDGRLAPSAGDRGIYIRCWHRARVDESHGELSVQGLASSPRCQAPDLGWARRPRQETSNPWPAVIVGQSNADGGYVGGYWQSSVVWFAAEAGVSAPHTASVCTLREAGDLWEPGSRVSTAQGSLHNSRSCTLL